MFSEQQNWGAQSENQRNRRNQCFHAMFVNAELMIIGLGLNVKFLGPEKYVINCKVETEFQFVNFWGK